MPKNNLKDERLVILGLLVRNKREAKNMTQSELAYKIDKDQPSINRLEKGNVNPSYIYLLEICEGLEIGLTDLILCIDL